MNSKFYLILILLLLSSNCFSQSVNMHFEGKISNYFPIILATFEFAELPKPLEPVRVDFTFEMIKELGGKFYSEDDWEFFLKGRTKDIRFLSGDGFVWNGPHQKGDIYTGSFEFVPLTSGLIRYSIGFEAFRRKIPRLEMELAYCIDIAGEVSYIGLSNNSNCNPSRSTYFGSDSILIIDRHELGQDWGSLFNYNINIQPPFKIGDTSTIQYRFTSYSNFDNGIDLVFESTAMDIVSLPNKIDYPIAKDQVVEIEVKVVPKAVKIGPNIWLRMNIPQDKLPYSERRQKILIKTVFNEDGSLYAVSDKDGLTRLKYVAPDSFEKYDYKIHKSKKKVVNEVEKD